MVDSRGTGEEDHDPVADIEIDALTLAGQQSLSGGEIGAAERAFSAALRRLPHGTPGERHGPGAGLAALTKAQRLCYELHGSRCEARLRLGLHFGALDDSVARLALASTKEAIAQGKKVDVALHGAPPPSPAKSRGGAASYAAALRMKGSDRPGRRRVTSDVGWWCEDGAGGDLSPSKTERGAEFRSVPGPGQRRSAAAAAVQEAKAAEATSKLRRSVLKGQLDLDVMRTLFHDGADIGQPDSSGRTILRLALANGQHRVVRMLLDYCYRELWLQQRVAWALATASESRVGKECVASCVSEPVVLAVVKALGKRCRENTAGLDKRVLRHMLERRQLALARDFGATTGAALISGNEVREKETAVRAANDLLAAIESPQR
eukprot:COSAG02_NODE_5263_length_4488_cov_2.690818_2_plen_378_part_00